MGSILLNIHVALFMLVIEYRKKFDHHLKNQNSLKKKQKAFIRHYY